LKLCSAKDERGSVDSQHALSAAQHAFSKSRYFLQFIIHNCTAKFNISKLHISVVQQQQRKEITVLSVCNTAQTTASVTVQ